MTLEHPLLLFSISLLSIFLCRMTLFFHIQSHLAEINIFSTAFFYHIKKHLATDMSDIYLKTFSQYQVIAASFSYIVERLYSRFYICFKFYFPFKAVFSFNKMGINFCNSLQCAQLRNGQLEYIFDLSFCKNSLLQKFKF